MWFSELTWRFSLFFLTILPSLIYPHYWQLFIKKWYQLAFCEITNSHLYNTVSVLRYLVKNIVIFAHFITLECTTSHQSHPTWSIIIDIDRYETSQLPGPSSAQVSLPFSNPCTCAHLCPDGSGGLKRRCGPAHCSFIAILWHRKAFLSKGPTKTTSNVWLTSGWTLVNDRCSCRWSTRVPSSHVPLCAKALWLCDRFSWHLNSHTP